MRDCKVDKEEAENAIDCYIEDNIPAVEIDLDSSWDFWVDYTEQEILTDDEVREKAENACPLEDWLDENYSASEIFIKIQEYSLDAVIDDYCHGVFDDFVNENELECFEIDD